MTDISGDLQRRLANMVRRGVIHSVQSGPIPKCRVDLGETLTDWLPVCQGFSGAYRSDRQPVAVGDAVTVLSEAGELNNGRVFPGWNTLAQPVPGDNDDEHLTRYGDGTEVRYNRNTHSLTITLAENGSYRITGKGVLDGPVEITGELTAGKNVRVNGSLDAGQDISDKSGKLSAVRRIFNVHDHPEGSGGTTRRPNQQM